MNKSLLLGTAIGLMLGSSIAEAQTSKRAAGTTQKAHPTNPLADVALDLPAKKFVLRNGLTLIVHEDHSAPLIAMDIWYHVGSKDEPKGRSGFAHLFEHLMFNGSENFNDDFYKATRKLGATSQNGTTSTDRTNYYQTIPKGALDAMLWLESDRMGHLLGAIDQAKLDEQRAVVKNEKRQGQNSPYSIVNDLIIRGTAPQGHPYDHSVIGSMDDLDAASLDDVKQWFRDYYGPNNAVLVLAGDVDAEEARAKVEKYFGDIPPGAPVTHMRSAVIRRSGVIRETAEAHVAAPALYRVWNVPEYGNPDTAHLQLLGQLLAGDRNSRLYKRLVVEERLASEVGAGVDQREIGGLFQISIELASGADRTRVEGIVEEELKRIAENPPSQAELDRVRTPLLTHYVRSFQSLARKAAILAESQTFQNDPDAWKRRYKQMVEARPADIQRVAQTWLSDGEYRLALLPTGDRAASMSGADRKAMPAVTPPNAAAFAPVERAVLRNGLKVALVRRPNTPLISMTMVVNSGISADYLAVKPGVTGLATALLTEGTLSRPGATLIEALARIGADVSADGDGETSRVYLSTLKSTLAPALELYADIIMRPAFTEADVDRRKALTRASLASAKQDAPKTADALAISRMFGVDSPYGRIPTEASVASIDRQDIKTFHDRWFRPNNATLVIVGDIGLEAVAPLVEHAFGEWVSSPVPEIVVPVAEARPAPIVFLVDKPGATQSVIRAALIAPPRTQGDEISRKIFNTVIGGTFTARINMKLREEKGWAYGASSGFSSGHGSRLFGVSASVQTDKTADAMGEIATMLKAAVATQPITADELTGAKDSLVLGLANAWSTNGGIASAVVDQISNGLPEDYYQGYAQHVLSARLEEVNRAAKEVLANQPLTWVVVGDLTRIQADIRALNLGEVRVIDAAGNPARANFPAKR